MLNINIFYNRIYEPHDHVLVPNTSPRYLQLWHRAHLSWYMAIPPSVDAKLRQYTQNQAITIEKLTRQVEELKCLLDPTRPKHTESKSVIQLDTKLNLSDPVRGAFARNLRAALVSKRIPSGNLGASGTTQWDPSYPLGNPQFSRSISSSLNNLYSLGGDALSSSGGAIASTSSNELTHSTMLRGDSPFGRFRNGSSAYSR